MNNSATVMGSPKATRSKALLGSNPMIRKISRITETSEDHVTFAGISNKCLYFMFTLIIGVAAAFILQNVGAKVQMDPIKTDNFTLAVSQVSVIGSLVFAVTGLLIILVPFFAFFMRKAASVLGTIYCFSAGYLFTYMSLIVVEYGGAVALALIITATVCTAMFLLYRSGKVVVTGKLRTVVITLVLANLLSAIILLIFSFIPALRFIPDFISHNGALSLIFAIIGVVIATLFLLVDFDAVTKAVENEIPVENEWYCAFGLAFSVIWLFMKILDLVLQIMAKKND